MTPQTGSSGELKNTEGFDEFVPLFLLSPDGPSQTPLAARRNSEPGGRARRLFVDRYSPCD